MSCSWIKRDSKDAVTGKRLTNESPDKERQNGEERKSKNGQSAGE